MSGKQKQSQEPKMASKPKGKTLAEFHALYDRDIVIPNKIRAAIQQLLAEGEENWEYEGTFIKRARISQTDVGTYRDQFSSYVVEAREIGGSTKRVWFASPKIAAKARGES